MSSPPKSAAVHSLLQSTIDGLLLMQQSSSDNNNNTETTKQQVWWLVNQDGVVLHRYNNDLPSTADTEESVVVVPAIVSQDEWNAMMDRTKQQEETDKITTPPTAGQFRLIRLGTCPSNEQETYYCLVGTTTPTTPIIQHKHDTNKYQETVDAAFDPMFEVDDVGTILLVNVAAIEQFGYTREELIGKNISMLCGGDPGHAERHASYMKRYLDTRVAHIIGKQRRVFAKRKDGSEFPVELGIREVSSSSSNGGGSKCYFCGFLRDVTREVEHEQELLEQEKRLEGMINASFDPMFEIDETGTINVVNDAAVHMFGWSREEFLGSNIRLICGAGHGPSHDSYLQRYLETGEKRIIGRKRKIKAKRKDGSEFDVELGVKEVVLSGAADGSKPTRAFCGYIRDLTQQYMDKRALRQKERMVKNRFFGSSSLEDEDDGSNNEKGSD